MRTSLPLLPLFVSLLASALMSAADVRLELLPEKGYLPALATDKDGDPHLLYLKGDPKAADIYYTTRSADAEEWAEPVKVNQGPPSALAVGVVRAPDIHVGDGGTVHVAWIGSPDSVDGDYKKLPLLYTRKPAGTDAFKRERNVIQKAYGLDGGVDVSGYGGRVLVSWHAGHAGEKEREFFYRISADAGATFAEETAVGVKTRGVCPCCDFDSALSEDGKFGLLYRSARQPDARNLDLHLLTLDTGESARYEIAPWAINACPVSTAQIAHPSPDRWLGAYEQEGQVFVSVLEEGGTKVPLATTDEVRKAKHPALAVNKAGQWLVAAVGNVEWGQEGDLAWAVYTIDGELIGEPRRMPRVIRKWSRPVVYAAANGDFVILY